MLPADQVIAAIGQSLDTDEILDGTKLNLTRSGFISINPVNGQTSEEWIFAGGDAVTGPASVVEAVSDGERAAVAIDEYLTGEQNAFWREPKEIDVAFDPDAAPEDYPRTKLRLLAVDKRRNNFQEVELPWTEAVAVREAKRCLRCDFRKSS